MGGKTSNESKRKYNEKSYDRIQLVVKKGKKEEIKSFARVILLTGLLTRLLMKKCEFYQSPQLPMKPLPRNKADKKGVYTL